MPEFQQLSFDLPEVPAGFQKVEVSTEVNARRGSSSALFARDSAPVSTGVAPMVKRGRGLLPDVELTGRCRELVDGLGLANLASMVKVFWNTRLVTTAGLAHHGSGRIDLNPRLEQFQPEEPRRTMLHELAHLVAHSRAGGRRIQPHGPEWRRACADLGIPGEQRCHSLPMARREVKRKFAYQCRHCATVVPRVKKLSRESACYPCCRAHNRGRYSRRFLLEAIPLEQARVLAPEHRWV